MKHNTTDSKKEIVVAKFGSGKKFWMTTSEYTSVIVGKAATNSEYVITEGVIEPNGFVPDHYHKWEDQTFHVVEGKLEAKIGDKIFEIGAGDTIHCPKGVSHYMKNIGDTNAKLISYIFPGKWAEDFMAATHHQIKSNVVDVDIIEEKYGVVYL